MKNQKKKDSCGKNIPRNFWGITRLCSVVDYWTKKVGTLIHNKWFTKIFIANSN